MATQADLEKQFELKMFEIYARAKGEGAHNASRFLQMLIDQGGLETAKRLLANRNLSDGFIALRGISGLELIVEATVLEEPWCRMFSGDELATAEKRLRRLGQIM